MTNKYLLFLIALLFLNFQCKKEGVCFLVKNNTNKGFYIFSKNEFEYYKDGFLSKQILKERNILEMDSNYVYLQEFELKKFEENNNIVSFYFCYDKKKYEKFSIDKKKIDLKKINKIIHNYKENIFLIQK